MTSRQQWFACLYKDFNAREVDAILASLHPEVDWPNAWEGGRLRGRDAVRDYWLRQWAVLDPKVEPVSTTEEGDTVVVDVHQVVHDLQANLVVDQQVQHVYRFRDGMVIQMDVREPGESSSSPSPSRS